MTFCPLIEQLLDRVGAAEDGVAWFTHHELSQHPTEMVQFLKHHQLLKRGREAKSVECHECEEHCIRPVESLRNAAGERVYFLLCQLRSDTNRVRIERTRLIQWRTAIESIRSWVAEDLGLRLSDAQPAQPNHYPIGLFHGERRSQMVVLEHGNPLQLIIGDQAIPLLELILFEQEAPTLDRQLVAHRVDLATTADVRYTPTTTRREAGKLKTEAMYEDWRRAYRKLRREHPNTTRYPDTWIAKQIARMDIAQGREPETIRKQMKK